MIKKIALTAMLTFLPINHSYAENFQTKLAEDYFDALEESVTEKKELYGMDSCTEEETLNTPYKCEDNYKWYIDGTKRDVHDYQRDQFSYDLLESLGSAFEETPFIQSIINWYDEEIKPWTRTEIIGKKDGSIGFYAPGKEYKGDEKWKVSLSPDLDRKDNSWGYNIGARIEAKYGQNFESKIVWQPEQKTTELSLNYVFSEKTKNTSETIQDQKPKYSKEFRDRFKRWTKTEINKTDKTYIGLSVSHNEEDTIIYVKFSTPTSSLEKLFKSD